jgi:hypothetical protein
VHYILAAAAGVVSGWVDLRGASHEGLIMIALRHHIIHRRTPHCLYRTSSIHATGS